MKRKNKVKGMARRIVIDWLGKELGTNVRWMSNRVAVDHVNNRTGQCAATIVDAARSLGHELGRRPKAKPAQKPKADKISAFYKSPEWKRARYDVLAANDGRCELCGAGKRDGVKLNVDHIRPLRLHWNRRLDRSNLQVLCGSCNQGKGNRDDTDWREPSLRVLMGEAMTEGK